MAWLIGVAGSLFVAGFAYYKRSLSGSGMAAAVFVGTLLYVYGTAAWFGSLLAFFVSSSILSKWKRKAKADAESGYEKAGARDAWQVFANGGIALMLCVSFAVWPHPYWWAAFVGVMATVNADTWATEIGGLSRRPPRSVLNGRLVPKGTSGGVTALGFAAAAGGALFIGVVAGALMLVKDGAPDGVGLIQGWALAAVSTASGFIGALADSVLGATVQRMNRCTVCGQQIERREHCGQPTVRVRGWTFMNNDMVNFISSLFGGAFAVLCCMLLMQTAFWGG